MSVVSHELLPITATRRSVKNRTRTVYHAFCACGVSIASSDSRPTVKWKHARHVIAVHELEPVDRSSAMWRRLRAACQLAPSYIDLDTHVDRVMRSILTRNGDGPGSASPAETRATRARQETP